MSYKKLVEGMSFSLGSWFVERVATNLRLPQKGPFGWFVTNLFLKYNSYLEENAVKMCNIKPDHTVLEIGFGPGVGLEAVHKILKGGQGKLYGIDTSPYMVKTASERVAQGIKDGKIMLFHGSADNIPLNTDSVHRVFHCNCYYFWPDKPRIAREIYRVMRPGGVMITTFNIDRIEKTAEQGYMKYGNTDPVSYMSCLEKCGFDNVHIEYHRDDNTGTPYQMIYAEITEKPAHIEGYVSEDEADRQEVKPAKRGDTNEEAASDLPNPKSKL